MLRADAMSARTGWWDRARTSFEPGAIGSLLPRAPSRLDATRDTKTAARRSEAWLRRLIPLVVVVLLSVLLAARVVLMAADSRTIDRDARASLAMAAELSTERLLDRPGLEDVGERLEFGTELLASLRRADDPTSYLLTTAAGRLLASDMREGLSAAHGGVDRTAVTELALPRIIVLLTNEDGAARIRLPDGSVHLAAAQRVTVLPSGATLVLLALRDEASVFADWKRDIALEIVIMAAVALSLGIMMFGYLRQSRGSRMNADRLREAQERFDTALLRGRCGMWDWDLARGAMTWSPSMFAMLGYPPRNGLLPVTDVGAWVHPGDLELLTMANEALEAEGTPIDRRFRMQTAAGEWTWLRLRAELVTTGTDGPRMVGIAVDISEQEALERESERADTRLRAAVESISEAFVLWDARRRLVLWNSKFEQFYALDGRTLVPGARYDDVVGAGRQPVFRREVNALRESEPGASTQEVELDDGRWLQVNERRTKDGGSVSIQTDITQIKRNEEKLLQSERRLMATVADLKETQLKLTVNAQHLAELADMYREASEKAEAGNRMKSEFMANISHELRTPLNAILGFSDLMTMGMFGPLGSPKYVEYAGDIHDSGQFLLSVINDVLDMSKIEAGRMQLHPEPLDLVETLDESLRIVDLQANEKDLRVRRTLPAKVAIEADRMAVKQILLNLLSNAVKFTPCGGDISVKVKSENGWVKMAIVDTGCGIGHDALRRIGVPFEQAQNAFTKNHRGSGLGLAIARSQAELHGGSLDVRSIEGKGTFVLVRLPVAQTPSPPSQSFDDAEPRAARPLARQTTDELAA